MTVAEKVEIRVRACGRSETGRVREHNEDRFVVHDLSTDRVHLGEEVADLGVGPRGLLFAVCDGMGGAAAGEEASRLGVEVVSKALASTELPLDVMSIAERIVRAAEAANQRIFDEAHRARGKRGMGTTGTFAMVHGGDLIVGQIGDSRAYLCRGGRLVQLTRDQSLVNRLIETGQLTADEARSFEYSNVILQALGTTPELVVPVIHVPLRRGDTLLLCSDGLSGQVEDEDILRVLSEGDDLEAACRELTERANDAGGVDNVTVVLARVDGALPEASEIDVHGLAPTNLPGPGPGEGERVQPDAGREVERRAEVLAPPPPPPETSTPPVMAPWLAWALLCTATAAASWFLLT